MEASTVMGSMMAAMGAWMMVWVVLGVVAVVAVVTLGVGMVQRVVGHRAPRSGIHGGSATVTGARPAASVHDLRIPDTMRASDADREYAAALLQEHTTAGRLSADEFGDRVQAVYAGRTVGDLRALLTDLPTGATRRPR